MWLTALVIVFVIGLLLYWDTIKPKKFPPGPKWMPIVGSAIEVNKMREKTGYLYKSVKQLAAIYCQGEPLIGLKIGKDRIVMVNTVEANKEMLNNEDIDGRPKGIFYQTRTWGKRRGVLLTDGELWKEQRRFLLKHLREFGFGRRTMSEITFSEAGHMINDVLDLMKNNNSAVVKNMHSFFNTYILNTLWSMMAGLRYKPNEPDMILLQNILFELFSAIDMVGCVFSHFPVLSLLAPKSSGYTDFIRTHKRIWKFLRDEITNHKLRFNPKNEDRDFMDAYIRVLNDHGEVNTYSEGQLVAICMDMFMAGTETTSKSLSFCFSYLVREQEVQQKAQEEIDTVIGKNRRPCLDDRPNMPYIEAIVQESIRHFMGRTFGVPHRALRNTTLAGYNIPEDTMVVSNFPNILMNPDLFSEPYGFKPERFIVDGKLSTPDYFFPFGIAKHRCLGDVLAKCNMFIFIATMLQRFNFLPCPGESLPSLDHVDGATASAAPFNCLVVSRM
ncbi:probable cytochrome P450 303a1 [Bicyclus anynana]|uniref:Probable cytochrome P450 303a1 n=1 Tax=Bicyclus anynana TaxID=110368 RepID=A0A6J1MZ92_BICAN|nr:probable cytochrome P450 303a1 [Bicyclus anynana]